jgi:hypothetical protein
MSSETSTKRKKRGAQGASREPGHVRQKPDSTTEGAGAPRGIRHQPDSADAPAFQAWHLFVVATLFASSAAALAVRGTSPTNVVFVCLTVLTAGVAAYAVYRTLAPLVQPESIEVPEMLGGRTRAALEREKTLVLRAIKELEFDRAMGKVSEADWQEMTARLRARAVRLIRQLDSGSAVYRDLIEKEISAREASSASRAAANGPRQAAGAAVLVLLVIGSLLRATPAQAQMGGMGGGAGMPDAKAMSGIPRPSETVPTGSVSVRLVRGQLSNLITDFPVEFLVDGKRQTVKTDATGHAVVSGLSAGAAIQATATVDGERLQSQEFQVPQQGGMVLMLVASDKTAQQQMAKDAVPGTVVLGNQSRVIIQFEDEVLQVFYLLDIVNGGAAPVKTASPLVFEMPAGAQNTSVLEGSSPAASAKGPRVTVNGPFAPGSTSVQVGFQLPPGDTARVLLPLPVDYSQPTVIVEKVGAMTLSSAQLPTVREANDAGKPFVMGMGPTLKAGQAFGFEVTGIPHHPTWPRSLALIIAVLVIAAGAWASLRRGERSGEAAARQVLEQRREAIFAQILQIEQKRKRGEAAEPDLDARRGTLVTELEKIYGELDADATGTRTDQGFAA